METYVFHLCVAHHLSYLQSFLSTHRHPKTASFSLLPLSLELYHNNSLSLDKIIQCLTINPAKILKIDKGNLKQGSDADLCIFDLEEPWKVKAEDLKSKSKNTAIENRKLQGKVKMTFLKGELVYQN